MSTPRLAYSSEQVARKEYDCQACLWVNQSPREAFDYISFADRRLLVKFVRQQKGKILKGQTYKRLTYSYDGELYTQEVHPDIHRIAEEHQLYPVDRD